MKTLVTFGLLLGLLATPAMAAGPVTRSFPASAERVWATTQSVLKVMGWDIDKEDRSIGFIVTNSRSVEGEDYGVYAKGTRQRLQISVKSVDAGHSSVSVERTVFKRERILWMDKDEPLSVSDQNVENALLDAIGRGL